MLVSSGAAPDVAVGGRLLVGVRREPFSLGIDGRMDFSASTRVGPGDIRTSLALATLVPCYHYRVLAGCALFGGGALRSSGNAFTDSRNDTTPFFVAGARALLEIPIEGPLFLQLHGDFLVPLSRTTVQVNQSEVWRTSVVSGVLGLGVGVNFP